MRRIAVLLLALASPVHSQWATPSVPTAAPKSPSIREGLPAATLDSYEGTVLVESAGRRVALQDAPVKLSIGDKVLPGKRSSAVIILIDGSRIEVGSNSQFTIESQGSDRVSLFLQAGKVWVSAVKRRFRNFDVRTPVTVASVRGTQFSVEAMERNAAVEVFEGSVAVLGGRGDQVLLFPNQRLDVLDGRLGRAERFEGRYEDRGRRAEPRKMERQGKEPERREKLKAALEREVGHQLARENIERNAAFDIRNAVYQEGRTMIDAFGKRVRVEEYLTRPDPRTFKYVTLNFREGRVDRGTFEVTANRELPRDLNSVNLWFSPTATQPAFWATRQRWVMTNGQDTAVQLSVDGVSRSITMPSEPIFDPTTNSFLPPQVTAAHVTVFGNMYEFLNGDMAQVQGIWANPLVRPNDGPGMMWHMIPVNMNINRVSDNVTLGNYWDYGFATIDGAAGSTGKMYIDRSFAPNPFLAHFVEQRSYVNFVDVDNNGVMNFDEPQIPASAPGNPFGVAVYHDKAQQLNGAGVPVAFDGGTGVGTRDTTGDNAFFSDTNFNGANDDGVLNQYTLGGFGPEPGLFTFAGNRAREWSSMDSFVIDDQGTIFNFGAMAGASKEQGAQLFQKLSYERVLRSSRFGGRKIDIVMTPRVILKSGLIDTRPQHEGVEGPGPN